MSENKEPYPVHEAITVLKGIDIYHTEKWWKAVLLTKTKWGQQIAVYMWIKDRKTGKWKRKQKASFKSKDELDKTYQAIVKLMGW